MSGRDALGGLHTLLHNAYRVFGSKEAFRDERISRTFAEVGEEVAALIRWYQANGIQRGDCIAVIAHGRVECAILDQASYLGGFIRLSLNTRLHPKEVLTILDRAEARTLVVDAAWLTALEPYRNRLRADLTLIALDPAPTGLAADAHDYAQIVAEGRSLKPLDIRTPEATADAQYSFTSGTTGEPKAAVHSLGAIAASTRNTMLETGAVASDVVYMPIPLSHVGGLFLLAYFSRGATQILASSFDAERTVQHLREDAVSALIIVPAMLSRLTAALGEQRVPTLKRIVYGSSPAPVADIVRANELFGPVLTQLYGQTESGLPITALDREDHRFSGDTAPEHLASAGRPSPFVEIRLASEDLDDVPPGEIGEVLVRSDAMMSRYLGDPKGTEATFAPGGWLRTGDLGRFDAEGRLYLVGRSRDVVISGGFNVYAVEVENVIAFDASVAEVAVVGLPSERWGETVAAALVLKDGEQLDRKRIELLCRDNLAGFKLPRIIAQLPELPRNAAGKVVKHQVRALLLETESSDG